MLLVTQAAPAAAGKVYRCGNAFQDLPCAEQKVADARPIVAPQATRDGTACVVNAKDPRSDCTGRAREPRTISQTDVKSR